MPYFYLQFLHVLGSQEQQLTQYIQDYFRAFLTCAHEISICAYTFKIHFVCYNFSFEEFFNSNCNIFSCNFFSVHRRYNVNSVSSPVLSVSVQIAQFCIELCNYRIWNFPKTRNKFFFYAKCHFDGLL